LALDDSAPTDSAIGAAPVLEPFGPYRRIEVLAEQGSIGRVAKGYNDAFGRWELLKFLRPELEAELELVRQFKREGRVLAQLSHPHVVQVFATYEVQGRLCLAMEYLEGQSLQSAVEAKSGKLEVDHALQLLLEAARGLAAAHEAGLLHRDIKPANLFVTSTGRGRAGGLKLIDFGLATADTRARASMVDDPALISGTAGGTPLFMAPELWLGQPATAKSDLFALGVTFYFAFCGSLPYADTTVHGLRREMLSDEPFPSLRSSRPDVPPAVASIVDRLMEKRPERRFPSAEELLASLVRAAAAARRRKVPGAGPYRGLLPYSASERDVFFGRDSEIADVIERLRTHAAVVLVGPTGSGKSSLALAGVAPAVEDGSLGGGVVFTVARVEPRMRPCRELASALAPSMGYHPDHLRERLRERPGSLGSDLRQALGESRGLLVILDQLEEVATVATDADDAAQFSSAVASLVEIISANVRVLATVRADLMDRLFVFEPLRHLLSRGFYPVRPLAGEALREAVVGPAQAAGYELEEPSVAQEIVEDTAGTRSGLPLMSFAMAAWWQARDEQRRVLPTAAWLALGGLVGALARHADDVLAGLSPEERRAASQILVRLVTAERTRAVVARAALEDPAATGAAGARALERLLAARLLIETGGDVELVHDALIEKWPALHELLASAGRDRVFAGQVAAGADQWEAQNRADGALWDGEQATRLLAWFEGTDAVLGQRELAFIAAVRRRVGRRRFVGRSLVAAALLAVLIAALVFAARQRRLATRLALARAESSAAQKAHAAETRRLLKQTARLQVERAPAQALRAALRSRELGADPALDTLAWQARLSGIPRALPLHPGGARLVRFDPKGRRIATCGRDPTVRVMAVHTAEVNLFEAPGAVSEKPVQLEFSPDGERLALALEGGAAYQVELSNSTIRRLGRCRRSVRTLRWLDSKTVVAACGAKRISRMVAWTVDGGPEKVLVSKPSRAVALSVGTRQLVTADAEGWLEVRQASSGETIRRRRVQTAPIARVGIATDGRRIVFGDMRGGLTLVELAEDGRLKDPLRLRSPHLSAIEQVTASPDGTRWLTVDASHRAALWDDGLENLGTLNVGAALVRWIPKRRSVAMIGPELDVLLLSADSGSWLGRLMGATGAIGDIAASPDGKWLAAASRDGGVRAWPLDEASAAVLRGPSSAAQPCAVSTDALAVACASEDRLRVQAVDPTASKLPGARELTVPAIGQVAPALAVGSGGQHVAWQSRGGTVVRVDGGRVAQLDVTVKDARLAFAHEGPLLAVAGRTSGGRPWCGLLEPDRAPRPLAVQGRVTALAFSHDDGKLALGLADGRLQLVKLPQGKTETVRRAFSGQPVVAIDIAREGAVAAASESGRVVLLPGEDSKPVALTRVTEPVRCVLWARDSRGLVVAADRRVLLADTETGTTFPLVRVAAGIRSCARHAGDDIFTFGARDGALWQRQLRLEPIWMVKAPDDPLDAAQASVKEWQGLVPPAR
jgi:serine/threonine protein kinase/WD40 repeat protein